MRTIPSRMVTLLSLAMAIAVAHTPAVGETVFPGANWVSRTPAEVGMDGAKLDEIASTIVGAVPGSKGCIVRYGYLVKTWGAQNESVSDSWASASKPVITTMLFFALKEGRISSVDDLVAPWWEATNPLRGKDRLTTFRHMANMTGTYTLADTPGQVWCYSDYNIRLYANTMFQKVYTEGSDAAAMHPSRLGALGIQDGSIFNTNDWVDASVRDFTRIGWLWLNKGNWNGTQLLPSAYFDTYMKPGVPPDMLNTSGAGDPQGVDYLRIGTYGGVADQTPYGPGIYGFNWWFNATGRVHPTSPTWPDAPRDAIQANGMWNRQVCTIIPSLKTVLTFQGNTRIDDFKPGDTENGANRMYKVLKLLKESIVASDYPLIALNPTAITKQLHLWESPTDDTFTVRNAGGATLHYTVSENQGWLGINPSSGSSTGEADTITLSYSTGGLPLGTYHATIEVTDNGSVPAAGLQTEPLAVSLVIKTVRSDLDGDGDVDQDDFGRFQQCFTPTGGVVAGDCIVTDINGDTSVNQSDFELFRGCFSGANAAPDQTCDDSFE